MSSRFYDAIIIGENSAGLIAAALLASRKYSVLVIPEVIIREQNISLGKSMKSDRAIYPGVFDYPVPTAVIRELNLGHKLRSIFKSAVPVFQAVDMEHRLTIFNDRIRLVTELQREYGKEVNPDDVGNLLSHLEEINLVLDRLLVPGLCFHPAGMKEKWDFGNRIKQFNKLLSDRESMLSSFEKLWNQSPLGGLMSRIESYAGNTRDGFYDLFAYRRANTLFNEVLYEIADESLDSVLLETIRKKSGAVQEQVVLEEVENGRNGYRLHDGKNSYGANSVICAFDFFNVNKLFNDKKTNNFVVKQIERFLPSHVWVKTNLNIERNVVPKAMNDNLFFMADDNGGEISFFHSDPLLSKSADFETLEISSPIQVDRLQQDKIKQHEYKMIDQAKWLIPFIETRINKIYLEKNIKEDGEKYLKIAGRNLQYTNHAKQEIFSGVSYNLPNKNTYLAGAEVAPELGLEGDFLTGWAIAQQVCRKWPRKDGLK